jgi:hypothetical protein
MVTMFESQVAGAFFGQVAHVRRLDIGTSAYRPFHVDPGRPPRVLNETVRLVGGEEGNSR